MNREQAIIALKEYRQAGPDAESWHLRADEVLCELLTTLGYKDVVEEWKKVDRWYA